MMTVYLQNNSNQQLLLQLLDIKQKTVTPSLITNTHIFKFTYVMKQNVH